MAFRINKAGNFRFVGASYHGAFNSLWGNTLQILNRFVADEGRQYLQAARLFNPSHKKVRVSGYHTGKEFTEQADGPGADILAWGITFTVPKGGYRGKYGRPLVLEKPGHIVFRARTYNRLAGQTITREGFFPKATQTEIMSPKGFRRAQRMIDDATAMVGGNIAMMMDAELEAAGLEVMFIQVSPGDAIF
jgi:hypothetical protein